MEEKPDPTSAARLLQQAEAVAAHREDVIDRRRLGWLSLIDAAAIALTILGFIIAVGVLHTVSASGPLFVIPLMLWAVLSAELRLDAGYQPRGALWHWLPEILLPIAAVSTALLGAVLGAPVSLALLIAAFVLITVYVTLAVVRARRQFSLATPGEASVDPAPYTRRTRGYFIGFMFALLGTIGVTVAVLDADYTMLWAIWAIAVFIAIGAGSSQHRLAPIVTAWRTRHWVAFAVGALSAAAVFWVCVTVPALAVPFAVACGVGTLVAGLIALRGPVEDG